MYSAVAIFLTYSWVNYDMIASDAVRESAPVHTKHSSPVRPKNLTVKTNNANTVTPSMETPVPYTATPSRGRTGSAPQVSGRLKSFSPQRGGAAALGGTPGRGRAFSNDSAQGSRNLSRRSTVTNVVLPYHLAGHKGNLFNMDIDNFVKRGFSVES